MKKQYIKPAIEIVAVEVTAIMAGSGVSGSVGSTTGGHLTGDGSTDVTGETGYVPITAKHSGLWDDNEE